MRSSRGMGAVRTSKMPKGSTITRKDNPDKVRMFAKGGKVKKAEGGPVQSFFKKRGIGTYTDSKGRVTTNNDLPSDVRDEVRSMGRVRNLYKEALALTSPKYAPDDYRSRTELLKEKQDEINRMYNPKTRGETLKKRLEDRVTPSKQAGGLMKKAKGGTVDPLKDKTGGKTDPEGGDYVIAGPAKGTKQKKPAPRPTTPSTPMPPKTGDKKDAEYGDYVIGKAKGGSANFIKGAIKKPGALRASLGAKPGKPIPAGKLDKASKAPGKLGQRARFAEMLRGFRKNKE